MLRDAGFTGPMVFSQKDASPVHTQWTDLSRTLSHSAAIGQRDVLLRKA